MREVGPDVHDAEHVHKKLAELVDVRRDRLDTAHQGGVTGALRHELVLFTCRCHTGAGRGNHGVITAECVHERSHDRDRLGDVAGVDVHLAAAGLGAREVDVHPEPAKQLDGGLTCLREHRVVQAGHEQCHLHQGTIRERTMDWRSVRYPSPIGVSDHMVLPKYWVDLSGRTPLCRGFWAVTFEDLPRRVNHLSNLPIHPAGFASAPRAARARGGRRGQLPGSCRARRSGCRTRGRSPPWRRHRRLRPWWRTR